MNDKQFDALLESIDQLNETLQFIDQTGQVICYELKLLRDAYKEANNLSDDDD